MELTKNAIMERLQCTKKLKQAVVEAYQSNQRKNHNTDLLSSHNEKDRMKRQMQGLEKLGGSRKMNEAQGKELGEVLSQLFSNINGSQMQPIFNKIQMINRIAIFLANHNMQDKIECLHALSNQEFTIKFAQIVLSWVCQWSSKEYQEIVQIATNILSPSKTDIKVNSQKIMKGRKKINMQTLENGKPQNIRIYSRASIFGCCLPQLEDYYSLLGIDDLDYTYIKNLKKRGNAVSLAEQTNLQKAAEILSKTKQNKQINQSIQKYINYFIQKFNISPQKFYTRNRQIKKKNLSHRENEYQNLETLNTLDLRHRKYNHEAREERKRCQTLDSSPKFQVLPPLKIKTRSFIREAKKIIKFPTEMGFAQENQNSQRKEKIDEKVGCNKPILKGVNVKNYISHKLKMEDKKKEVQNSGYEGYLSKEKLRIIPIENVHVGKIKKTGDLRSLRQKTKAILRNFQIMNHYY